MGTEDEKLKEMRNKGARETNAVALILNVDLERLVGLQLEAAARSVHSEEASILVRDGKTGDLRFLKAIGQVGDQLEGVVIPSGKGIASFVVSSGQPMAISDVGRESTFYAEIDKKTGFSTEILLATPLIVDDEIIGVLEFVNRKGDPPYDPFTPVEMDRAAIHAEGIAALVSALMASRLSDGLAAHICEGVSAPDLKEQRRWIANQETNEKHKELLDLAVLVKGVARQSTKHRKLCKDVLESLIEFTAEAEGSDFSDV